ncbi:MAG: hypothetical protein MUE30_03355 [Spirosomaceae bacterium]|jgi:hypothetical protein|nr:hypothetical protein [Spirosomataceae bacterium]
MEPILIHPLHEGVMDILRDLEKVNLLKISKPIHSGKTPPKKLSERLRGSISHETAEALINLRNEWERNI